MRGEAKKTVDDVLPEEGSATVASDWGMIGWVSSQSSLGWYERLQQTSRHHTVHGSRKREDRIALKRSLVAMGGADRI